MIGVLRIWDLISWVFFKVLSTCVWGLMNYSSNLSEIIFVVSNSKINSYFLIKINFNLLSTTKISVYTRDYWLSIKYNLTDKLYYRNLLNMSIKEYMI